MRDKRDSLDDVVRDILRSMVAGELGPLVERFRTTVESSLATAIRQAFQTARSVDLSAQLGPPDVLRPLAALQSVPVVNTGGGVYFLVAGERVIYVGQSVNVFSRVGSHLESKVFDRAFYLPLPNAELDLVESAFISWLAPPLNGVAGAKVDAEAAFEVLHRLGVKASLEELDAGRIAVSQRLRAPHLPDRKRWTLKPTEPRTKPLRATP